VPTNLRPVRRLSTLGMVWLVGISVVALVVAVTTCLLLFPNGPLLIRMRFGSPATVIDEFDHRDDSEATLMDPLLLAGSRAEPWVLAKLSDRGWGRRRYAIGALEDIGTALALPQLRTLAADVTERDYIRRDAITSARAIEARLAMPPLVVTGAEPWTDNYHRSFWMALRSEY
jgi:hypothetical protein